MNMTDASPKFCSHCGAALRPGVRFCEECGVAVAQEPGHRSHVDSSVSGPNREGTEHLIGQAPCEWFTGGRGLLGGRKTIQGNLVITDQRILFIRETDESNTEEMAEDERISEEADRRECTLRELVRGHDWFSGPGRRFTEVPLDELLGEDRKNWALPLDRIVGALVVLPEEADPTPEEIMLELDDGSRQTFHAFRASGEAVFQWLIGLLGAGKVRLSTQPPIS